MVINRCLRNDKIQLVDDKVRRTVMQQCSLNEPAPRIAEFAYPGRGQEAGALGYALGAMFWLVAVMCGLASPLLYVICEIFYRISHGPVVSVE